MVVRAGGRRRRTPLTWRWQTAPDTRMREAAVEDSEKEEIGKVAGMGAGLLTGAKIGSVVMPIPVVGAFAGGVIGAALGSEVGKVVGKALLNGSSAFVDTIKGEPASS